MFKCVVLCLLGCVSLPLIAATPPVPDYERQPGVAGKITSVGSDTLANLMTFWSQEFKKYGILAQEFKTY